MVDALPAVCSILDFIVLYNAIFTMKRIIFILVAITTSLYVFAQSTYDAKEAFNPQFYPYPGNEYRSASGEPGPKYWQNKADYKIDVTLDTARHSVKGKVEVTYTNNSPDNLKFLWLQLDQNIYRKDSRGTASITTSNQEEGGGRYTNTEYTEGYIIQSITVEAGGKQYNATYTINDTRLQIGLQDLLKAAGGKVKFTISFEFIVPEYGTDRMGRLSTKNGLIYSMAQWFPRMCVYDDLQGWNVLPYLGAGEFYLEYGDIEFSVTAPSNLIIVGSGELLNPQECFTADQLKKYNEAKNSDKTVIIRSAADIENKNTVTKKTSSTWKFKIQNTRDVAWAASRSFILDGARINLPSGKKALALSAYPIESAKEKSGNDWRRSTEMVKGSIEYYSAKWLEYPYTTAVNVASNVGGMEYPGIVFCSYKSVGSELWAVTDHEFGHIWFPMIVGSNERKHAWMDEGFTTFINDLSTEAFNKGEFVDKGFFSDPNAPFMVKYTFGDEMDGLYTIPDAMQEMNIGIAAYMKPSQMLHILRDIVLGKDRFDAAFKEYINRWAYKHPTPWDFFHTMENVAGEDLAWFWRSWVLNNWKLDQAVKGVKYEKNIPANGALITIENKEKMPLPVTVLVKETTGKEHTIQLPVEIWTKGATWTFKVPSTAEIKEVIIDPDKKLPDWNRDNNTWKKGF